MSDGVMTVIHSNGKLYYPAWHVDALAARLAEAERDNAMLRNAWNNTIEAHGLTAAQLVEAERVLRSIATNTCCESCREAALVAQAYFGPADSADPVIHAQHDETGRMWTGPRSQLPPRYAEVSADVTHASDCALHNEPAYPAGPCNCGAKP